MKKNGLSKAPVDLNKRAIRDVKRCMYQLNKLCDVVDDISKRAYSGNRPIINTQNMITKSNCKGVIKIGSSALT